ncbi:MAG: hypothetical protein IPI67_23410 [Myxococcales bacterium]|nr:hypothetical protein [Myxococcales bacterium]
MLNKNLDNYDRERWVTRKATILGDRAKDISPPAHASGNGQPRSWS